MKKFKSRKKRKRLSFEKYENVYMTKFITDNVNRKLFNKHCNFIYSFEGVIFNREFLMNN